MSELINNREYRQKVLKELITELHHGKTVEEVKDRFEKLIEGVSASEIAEMEQSLIMEGMPVEQIQNLCDVHAAVFKGSIEEIHRSEEDYENHPLEVFDKENSAIQAFINETINPILIRFKKEDSESSRELKTAFQKLLEIDKHYSRKENLLFPYLEKYNITAPPKVMWGVDDEIRDALKEIIKDIDKGEQRKKIIEDANTLLNKITEMIFKEENILFPMAQDTLTEDEWRAISHDSDEIGYTFIEPQGLYNPDYDENLEELKDVANLQDAIPFDAGYLTAKEANAIFNTLPIDATFVDKNGHVKYFTQGKERIFARPKSVLGRDVANCHPPSSLHIVEKIVEDLQSGKKDHEDFWIKMGDQFVYIRYFAVRDKQGEYLGILEVTQNIKPIQELKGEKRLAD